MTIIVIIGYIFLAVKYGREYLNKHKKKEGIIFFTFLLTQFITSILLVNNYNLLTFVDLFDRIVIYITNLV